MMGGTVGLQVVTANVNGIRATARRGGLRWLARIARTRCVCRRFGQPERRSRKRWPIPRCPRGTWRYPAPRRVVPGWRSTPEERWRFETRFDSRRSTVRAVGSRWTSTESGPVTVASVYVHSGEAGTVKQEAKYAFLEGMDARLRALARRASRNGVDALVCGDFNIAHHEVDIKNWKGNLTSAGFLPDERRYLDRWFAGPWTDLGRSCGGQGPGPYTWWSARAGIRQRAGWRIDYQVATPALAARARSGRWGARGPRRSVE